MMVRGRELHCRQGWGRDRWDMAADDVVLDVRVRQPDGVGRGHGPAKIARNERPSMAQSAEAIISAWSADGGAEAGAER